MKAWNSILFLIFISVTGAASQPQLVLLKRNKIVSRFNEGDHIRFQCKDRDFISSGVITGIHQSFIKMGEDDTTYLDQFKWVDLRRHSNFNFKTASSGKKLIIAGIVLVLMDLLNPGETNTVDRGLLNVSSVFIGTGILLQFVNNNYFKIGRRKKVTILG